MDITELLAFSVKNKASDLHLSSGLPPMIRVHGDVRRINLPAMEHKDVHGMVYDIMNDGQRKVYEETLECDFSFEIPNLARFRVNAFNQHRGAGAVFRTIPSKVLTLEELNAPKIFREICEYPRGIVLVTGPTGSGKTVSLYTALNILNDDTRNISTVEDPVEIRVPGINQVQQNQKRGMTFAAALRSFLRQDPDVIMVGEIRDLETAEIAVKAAQTGHMVLSTLHTNDAPQTVARLMNMGIAPYNIISSVTLVIAQRLARRLHDCKRAVHLPDHALLAEGFTQADIDAGITLFEPVGCPDCTEGYKGRTGIYQVMPMTEEIQSIILEGGNAMQIAEAAQRSGIRDLRQSALMKARNGVTSLAEINRVTKD